MGSGTPGQAVLSGILKLSKPRKQAHGKAQFFMASAAVTALSSGSDLMMNGEV